MAITITKAEYDALPDALKAKFGGGGDAYFLQEEDIEGLKKSKAEILAEKKSLEIQLKELEAFKAGHEEKESEAAQKQLEAEGKYKEALDQREKAWQERHEAQEARLQKIMGNLHRDRLAAELTKRGVLPDRVSYLASELLAQTDFNEAEDGFALTKKGGVGDAAEFDGMINAAKAATPFFFAPTTTSGGGASGSQGNGSNGTNTEGLSPVQKLENIYASTK